MLARGHHFPLLLPVQRVMLVLHRDERRQAFVDRVFCQCQQLRGSDYGRTVRLTLHQLELVRPATAHADIPDLPTLHDIMQRLHRLLDGRVIVEAVALEDVDVVQLQALQRILDRREDAL